MRFSFEPYNKIVSMNETTDELNFEGFQLIRSELEVVCPKDVQKSTAGVSTE